MKLFEIFLILIVILGIIYLFYSFIKFQPKKEARSEKKEAKKEIKHRKDIPDFLEPYMMAGEIINDTFRLEKSLYRYYVFFTNHRILKMKETIFGLRYLKDMPYRFLNSISVNKVFNKKGIYLSISIILISIATLVITYFNPDLITVTSPEANKLIFYLLLVTGLTTLFFSSIGRKYIYFTSYNTVMKVPFEERLVKEAREYQQMHMKGK